MDRCREFRLFEVNPPSEPGERRYFEELVSARADEIVAKWIDFFVLHKSIKPEYITRRLK